MAEYIESEAEKQELHEAYRHEIKEIENAFDKEWKCFIGKRRHRERQSWRRRLAQKIPMAEEVEIPELPDTDYTAVEVELDSGDTERWWFFNYRENKRWAGIVKEGWWRDAETWDKKYQIPDGSEGRLISIYHLRNACSYDEVKNNKEFVLSNKQIKLSLTQGSGSHETFKRKYAKLMRESYTAEEYPRNIKPASGQAPLQIIRDIPMESNETFFEAYISALSEVFVELVTDSRQMVTDAEENMQRAREMA
jgi:hypothetical protein